MSRKIVYRSQALLAGRNRVQQRADNILNAEFVMSYWKVCSLTLDLFYKSKQAQRLNRFIKKRGENRLDDVLATLAPEKGRTKGAKTCSRQIVAENYKPIEEMTPLTQKFTNLLDDGRHLQKLSSRFHRNFPAHIHRMRCCWCC